MNKYEGMFLLDNSKVKPDVAECVAAVSEAITKHGGTIVRAERWDERKLAYEIRKQKRGTYVLAHFEADPTKVAAIRNDVNLNENFLRSMVIRCGEDFPTFLTAADYEAMRPRREEEPAADVVKTDVIEEEV